jgi:hypothetical protein
MDVSDETTKTQVHENIESPRNIRVRNSEKLEEISVNARLGVTRSAIDKSSSEILNAWIGSKPIAKTNVKKKPETVTPKRIGWSNNCFRANIIKT